MISKTMISSRPTFLLLLLLLHTTFLHPSIGHGKNDDLKLYDEELLEEVRGLTSHECYYHFPMLPTTGDMVAFRFNGSSEDLEVLMVKHKSLPDKDAWATPKPRRRKLPYDTKTSFILKELKELTGLEKLTTKYPYRGEAIDLLTRKDVPLYDLRSAPAHKEVSGQAVFITTEQDPVSGNDPREARFIPLSEIYNGKHEIAFNNAILIEEAVQKMSKIDITGMMDEKEKNKFVHYSQSFNERKIQTIIESNENRNANKAKAIRAPRIIAKLSN